MRQTECDNATMTDIGTCRTSSVALGFVLRSTVTTAVSLAITSCHYDVVRYVKHETTLKYPSAPHSYNLEMADCFTCHWRSPFSRPEAGFPFDIIERKFCRCSRGRRDFTSQSSRCRITVVTLRLHLLPTHGPVEIAPNLD
jgi:hypothetical protein